MTLRKEAGSQRFTSWIWPPCPHHALDSFSVSLDEETGVLRGKATSRCHRATTKQNRDDDSVPLTLSTTPCMKQRRFCKERAWEAISQEGEKGCTRQKKRLKGILYSANSQAMNKPQQHSPCIGSRGAPRGGGKRAREKSSTRLLQLPKLDPVMSPTLPVFSHISPESTCH